MNSTVMTADIGLWFDAEKQANLRLWAPVAQRVDLIVSGKEDRISLEKQENGYWSLQTSLIKPGDRYRYSIDGGEPLPDPASRSQPDGVHGDSEALDLHFNWGQEQQPPLELEAYIFYELHTGTFSKEGNFEGIAARLDHLVELGVTAIEIMPVAAFPGNRNWGYDGVFPFAVHHDYGGAKGLQQLVAACHHRGLAVVLDVVYNHLGPEGNYLAAYGPYFTGKYKTPWGGAINFDGEGSEAVRDFFISNAIMWFRDFRVDALRLDAVHAIFDDSPEHILLSIKKATDALNVQTGRHHFLIVESDLNDPRYISPVANGGYGMDAQWVDEFHHALRVTATGEQQGYYEDFNGLAHLSKSYRDVYVYDGQFSKHRKRPFGEKAGDAPGRQFVVFSQNHDQVGNRMLGERTSVLVSREMQKLLAGAVLLSPYLPLLFMGEEWGETNPFLYFASHTDPLLADAVRKGRRAEFAAFHANGEAPDPMAEETFIRSKLQWDLLSKKEHAVLFSFYKTLIRLRRTNPVLKAADREGMDVQAFEDKDCMWLHRRNQEDALICFQNYSSAAQEISIPIFVRDWKLLLNSADPQWGGKFEMPLQINGEKAAIISLPPESVSLYYYQHV